MDVTNRYVLDFARRFAASRPGARILDFGCGAGELVAEGFNSGLDFYGVDVYYEGSQAKAQARQSRLFGTRILEMQPNRAPFPGGYFDLITNNQVLEHVEDLRATLAGLHLLLKPDGVLLSIFPSRDVFREGHIGIPFAHWFRRDSRLRLYYTWALRRLGFGYHKHQAATCRQWAIEKLGWIDKYTCYRTRREIFQAFGEYFVSEEHELDYIRYRMKATSGARKLAWLAGVPVVAQVGVALFRKLAFLVLVSRKKTP